MRQRLHSPLILLLIGLGLSAGRLPAQTETSAEESKRSRAISSEVASALAAGMPKYEPPKPAEPKVEAEEIDLRETDQPRNRIIRLPDYVVQEKKPPVFRERDLHTRKGLVDLAKQRYFSEAAQGLNRFRIPLFGQGIDAYALQMQADAERLQNITDLKETADTIRAADPENATYIRRLTDDTYIRRNDFGYRRQP
ncbi:MAG TPA: hypothetical protein PLF88_10065 [Opitutaceae bacterium]|nr:hypothetical protein [Opitutaceae bacterium]HRJ48719.1 hypothetical protein [Opitutaceae bacterium]